MANRHGCPIWYELVTPDPDGAAKFYEAVTGWSIAPAPSDGYDYRMIAAADATVGGILKLDAAMAAGGAQPRWLLYVGVEDVDATVAQARSLDAQVIVPPTDIPGIGRFAFLVDPQGAPFYVMRGASDGESTAFARFVTGHFAWNELATTDVDAALAFYGALFGWTNRDTMPMADTPDYHFLEVNDERFAAMVEMKGRAAAWRLYIRVDDIHAAIAATRANGGWIDQGPLEVPGGDVFALGADPQGAAIALVAAGKAGG